MAPELQDQVYLILSLGGHILWSKQPITTLTSGRRLRNIAIFMCLIRSYLHPSWAVLTRRNGKMLQRSLFLCVEAQQLDRMYYHLISRQVIYLGMCQGTLLWHQIQIAPHLHVSID